MVELVPSMFILNRPDKDNHYFTIMAKEGRLLKPHTPGLSDHDEAAQEKTFIYETVGNGNQESIPLVLPEYQLPDIKTGGPGIAPVATLDNLGLAILTDKITGDYTHIPRTKAGGRWEKRQTYGYRGLIQKLQNEDRLIDIEESVLACVPNWINPEHFYILYKEEQTGCFLNYKCLQYDFNGEGYPVDGIQFKTFRDLFSIKEKKIRRDSGDRKRAPIQFKSRLAVFDKKLLRLYQMIKPPHLHHFDPSFS